MGSGCSVRGDKKKILGGGSSSNIISLKSSSEHKGTDSFKVNYTDFIRKKTNMIVEDYKIKSSPLGKGFYKLLIHATFSLL